VVGGDLCQRKARKSQLDADAGDKASLNLKQKSAAAVIAGMTVLGPAITGVLSGVADSLG